MLFKKKIEIAKEDVIKNDVLVVNLDENEIKKAVEGGSINILLGAGFTANIFSTLNNIEELFAYVNDIDNDDLKDIIAWEFFKKSILPMADTPINEIQMQIDFFKILRSILTRRGNPVKNKQANIFTTNYDVVPEQVLEHLNMDYNDGFKGKINPIFSTANFGNILIKNLIFSNNKAEIETYPPVDITQLTFSFLNLILSSFKPFKAVVILFFLGVIPINSIFSFRHIFSSKEPLYPTNIAFISICSGFSKSTPT